MACSFARWLASHVEDFSSSSSSSPTASSTSVLLPLATLLTLAGTWFSYRVAWTLLTPVYHGGSQCWTSRQPVGSAAAASGFVSCTTYSSPYAEEEEDDDGAHTHLSSGSRYLSNFLFMINGSNSSSSLTLEIMVLVVVVVKRTTRERSVHIWPEIKGKYILTFFVHSSSS